MMALAPAGPAAAKQPWDRGRGHGATTPGSGELEVHVHSEDEFGLVDQLAGIFTALLAFTSFQLDPLRLITSIPCVIARTERGCMKVKARRSQIAGRGTETAGSPGLVGAGDEMNAFLR
jgi:hypothetical protein